jgi:hypothetical protein
MQETFDFTKLQRDPAFIKSTMVAMDNKTIVTKTGCKIIFPVSFVERGLAVVGVNNVVTGFFCTMVGEKFALSMINAQMVLTPTVMRKIKIEGVEYYEFEFAKGAVVIANTMLVKNDLLVYKIYLQHVAKGKVPPYMTYEDMAGVFDTTNKYAGANIGQQREVTELILSLIARDAKQKNIYYSQTGRPGGIGSVAPKPYYISLRDVQYGAATTMDKLTGAYAGSQGIVAALNNPSERTERVEGFLRA